jgi:hypothetical protein
LENISFLLTSKNWINIFHIRTVDIARFKRKFGELSELSKSKFLEIKTKTAEVVKLPPQWASAHNPIVF